MRMSSPFTAAVGACRQEMLEFLTRVVEMESPTLEKGHVDAVVDVFESAYRELGFRCRRLRQDRHGDHLVADGPRDGGPPVLPVRPGHPLGTLATMPLRREGDRMRGPGVMDMKGGLAVMLFAVRCLLRREPGLRGAVRIVINSDEEPGSPTSRELWPELTRDVDYALVLEPAQPDGGMVLRRKGVG